MWVIEKGSFAASVLLNLCQHCTDIRSCVELAGIWYTYEGRKPTFVDLYYLSKFIQKKSKEFY